MSLLCQSHRIVADISQALQKEESESFDLKLVIRKWYDGISLEDEFRGLVVYYLRSYYFRFVHNGQLTALSQYYHFCYFPSLIPKHDEIQGKITTFWKSIKDSIPLPSYVIDFCLYKDQVLVIELNPFVSFV
jgi:hypothetical protein